MTLVDAHVHLPSYADPSEVVKFAVSTRFLLFSAATDHQDSRANLQLKLDNPSVVRSFVGIHPSSVTSELPSTRMRREFLLADGIGEIGLDPRYSSVGEGNNQLNAFRDQLGVAETLGKPVQVHSRSAERLCLDSLARYKIPAVLLHWFEGEEHASTASARGYYVSFGPALLYSKKLRRIAAGYPADLILTESDGPVAYPALSGSASGPVLVASTVFALAEVVRVQFSDLEAGIHENSLRFLGEK